MERPGKESDQLPEEAPDDQVADDSRDKRDDAHESPGGADGPKRATGSEGDE